MSSELMPVFFHPEQLPFRPRYEWAFGARLKHPETTRRAESIIKALKKDPEKFELQTPKKRPIYPLRQMHGPHLLALYHAAQAIPDGQTLFPNVFPKAPVPGADPNNLQHAGQYCYDSLTPLNAATYDAATWSAACAYEAASFMTKGGKMAYALSRPPGHHCTKRFFGGYSYFNNVALAAKRMKKGGSKVAIIDIDFHHGNGTQDIFYSDSSVLTISIHGDPNQYYPFYWGFPEEIGRGRGLGMNANFPVHAKTTGKAYCALLKEKVFPMISKFRPDYLIIAAGMDTYRKDPIGHLEIDTEDFFQIGKTLKSLDLPTLVVQEGGYFHQDLGVNVSSFLKGLF